MNSSLRGVVYIAIGACSYGVLATFVKLANGAGHGTAGLAFSQYLFGALVLTFISMVPSRKVKNRISQKPSNYSKLKLMLYGTSLGLTSSFYYLSIQYVPVSIGIILLMQTIWMGVVLEFFIARHLINNTKIIGAVIAIIGTILAAKVIETEFQLDIRGIGFGLLAALSFTGVMYATSRIALHLPNVTRTKYLVYGGFLAIVLFWNVQICTEFNWFLFLKWGSFLGLFGTIVPPVLFSKGFPLVGTGLGSIVAALEIPISVLSAYWLLEEQITWMQWLGIVIIIFAVVIINLKRNF